MAPMWPVPMGRASGSQLAAGWVYHNFKLSCDRPVDDIATMAMTVSSGKRYFFIR